MTVQWTPSHGDKLQLQQAADRGPSCTSDLTWRILHTNRLYVSALTHSAARHHFKQVRLAGRSFVCLSKLDSVFSGAYTPWHALIPPLKHTWLRPQTYTLHAHAYAHTRSHTSTGVVLAEGKQQWCGTGLFFSAGQTLARPGGSSHPIPPGELLVCGTRLNLHLLRGLHFRYIVQKSLNTAERRRDAVLKSTPRCSGQPLYWALRVTSIPGPYEVKMKCSSSCGHTHGPRRPATRVFHLTPFGPCLNTQ